MIQYLSDLHLELVDIDINEILIPEASNLAILGNLGNPFKPHYQEFLEITSKLFIRVFVIAGEQEYSYSEMTKVDQRINEICSKFDNIYYLNHSEYKLDQVTILGTTLWSEISNANLHYQSCDWLNLKILEHDQVIILTHYDQLDYLVRANVKGWLTNKSNPRGDPYLVNKDYNKTKSF